MTDPQKIDAPTIEAILRLSLQQQGNLIKTLTNAFAANAADKSQLGVMYSSDGGTTIVSSASGYLIAVVATVPSTASDFTMAYDANDPVNVSSSNAMAQLPLSGYQIYNLPYLTGLTVQATSGSSHTLAIYYT